jgi:hypothetical protein
MSCATRSHGWRRWGFDVVDPDADMIDLGPVSVHEALSLVMRDVTHVGKDGFNEHQKFSFRGVDDTINAVGPVLRRHGVLVTPRVLSIQTRDFRNANDKFQHEAVIEVEYTYTGPDGSKLVGSAVGEAADSGDKATSKAMSVAYRTFLLQSLCIPTDEPDPDETTVDRGAPADDALRMAQRALLAEVKSACPDLDQDAAAKRAREVWDKHGQDPKRLTDMIAEVKA